MPTQTRQPSTLKRNLSEELTFAVAQALDRFANQLSALNDYLRRDDERLIIMSRPRVLQFVAGDVGQWKKVADMNQYRYDYGIFRTAAAGTLYVASQKMEKPTDGIPLDANESYPLTARDRHQGEIWVNPDAATIVAVFVQWIRTPLTPKHVP